MPTWRAKRAVSFVQKRFGFRQTNAPKNMKKEKMEPITHNPDAIRKLESLRYVFRGPQNVDESGDQVTYEWLEDSVIREKASVVFGKDDTGKDTATIKMVNPKTEKEESVYYTTDQNQVKSLKIISEGKTLVKEEPDE